MAKERAIELIDQAQEIINKDREPTSKGSQSFLDDVKAWEKACGRFVLEHGPNAKNDIPREQMRGIKLAAKDLEMERRLNVFMREVNTRTETFLSRMNDPGVDHEKERTALESSHARYDEFIKRFKGSTRTYEFQERRPDDAAEMMRKMEETVSNLRHTLLVTPSILDEFADEPDEAMHKSISTMTKLLEFEKHPSIDQIKAKRSALSRKSYEEDSSESDDERNSKLLAEQRDLLEVMLGVIGPKIAGNQALLLRYEKNLKKFNDPSNNTMENQNKIAGQVIRLHESVLGKRINDALKAMRTLLDKSDKKNESPDVRKFRKIFEGVERDHKKSKDDSLDYKMANLLVLEGSLENLKRLMSEQQKSEPPKWKPSKTSKLPVQFRESGNFDRQSQNPVTNKPMMGRKKKENLSDDTVVPSRGSKGPSIKGSSND